MSNWDILGIAPTTDKRVIKRAYAKMLAKYHPEEYPEKFEEINQAYQWALGYFGGYDAGDYSAMDYAHESEAPLEVDDERATAGAEATLNADEGPVNDSDDSEDDPSIDMWWQKVEQFMLDDEAEIPDMEINFEDIFSGYNFNYQEPESIFVSDTVFETVTEEQQLAEKALNEFSLTTNVAKGNLFQSIRANWALQAFVAGETFKAVRRNPIFIEGLVALISSVHFSNQQIGTLRKALGIKIGIKKTWDASRYQGATGDALEKLDSLLKERVIYNFTAETKLSKAFSKIGIGAAVMIVFVLAVATVVAPGRESPGSGSARGIVGQPFPTLPPAPRQTSITLEQTQEIFEATILSCPDTIAYWQEWMVANLTDWLYAASGQNAILVTTDFDFLKGVYEPQLLFYRYPDSIQGNMLILSIYFADTAPVINEVEAPWSLREKQLTFATTWEDFVAVMDSCLYEHRRMRDLIIDMLVTRLYEQTGREVVLVAPNFSFLYGVYDMPEQILFEFVDGPEGEHWVHLYVVFDVFDEAEE